eukprot:Filipodium_phascolosomae@DN2702_c0_g1_i1.p1
MKGGEQQRILELVFADQTPPADNSVIEVQLPDGYAFSSPSDCKQTVYEHHNADYVSLDVKSCTATGSVARFQLGEHIAMTFHWMIAFRVNSPVFPTQSSFKVKYSVGGPYDVKAGDLKVVKGSAASKAHGGHEIEAVMRPVSIAATSPTLVTFHFELTTEVKENGGIVIAPPAGLTLAAGACDSPSVDVKVYSCTADADKACDAESVSAAGGKSVWKCYILGDAIRLTRVQRNASRSTLEVGFE